MDLKIFFIYLSFVLNSQIYGYYLNTTREESITSLLWHKYQQIVGLDQITAEKLTDMFFGSFKCLRGTTCLNCKSNEYVNLVEGIKRRNVDKNNLIETCNVLLSHVFRFGSDCNFLGEVLSCNSSTCVENFLAAEVFGFTEILYHDEDPVEKGLSAVRKNNYIFKNNDECFTKNDLLRDYTEDGSKPKRNDVKFLVTALVLRLANGDCFSLESEVDFMGDIFEKYGSSRWDVITVEGLVKLMVDLGIVQATHDHDHDHDHNRDNDHDHDHNHDHDHEHHHDHDHNHSTTDTHNHDHSHDHNHSANDTHDPQGTLQHDYKLNHGHDHDHDHTEGRIELIHFTDNEQHSRQNLSSSKYDFSLPRKESRKKRALEDKQVTKNDTNDCWTAEELFKKFDSDTSEDLNRDEFLHLCPALLQQRLKGKCSQTITKDKLDVLEVYGYGTLAVFLISLCSIMGVVLMPIKNSNVYQYFMMCFIALAFGTLTGDALLHLIPEAVGLHTHDDDGHDHDHDHGGQLMPDYFWKFMAVLVSVYGLFVVESVSGIAMHGIDDKEENKGHGHSHIPNIDLVRMATKKEDKTISTETLASRASGAVSLNVPARDVESHNHKKTCWGMTTLALVIIVGDGIHNIADGLTIGAAFSSSIKGGISSALAIFFHELPHEFGDFVILLSTGFSYKKALFWNFLSSLTAFIGLYIGIELGESETARQWILAIAAGMFLYIALGDMLPELKNQKGKSKLFTFLAQNFGVLFGMGFMTLLSVFEDKIKI